MKKLKSLILTICFMIVVSSSNIYATNRAIQYETTTSGTTSPPTAGGKTELDGKIGEWDPNDSDRPNFDDYDDDPSNIEGTIPGSDKYFTISATVPISMEFIVLPNSHDYRGSFYSPEYTIKNNGSKTISVKVKNVINTTKSSISSDKDPLYVKKVVQGDGESQIELFLRAIDGNNKKDIKLYGDLTQLAEEEKTLYSLEANETKQMKLYSDTWDLPWNESGKDEAEANFNLKLEFSVVTPSATTP